MSKLKDRGKIFTFTLRFTHRCEIKLALLPCAQRNAQGYRTSGAQPFQFFDAESYRQIDVTLAVTVCTSPLLGGLSFRK